MSNSDIEQPEFLADIQKLKEQIGSLKKRLNLVEDNREKVRQKIYEKVKAEYEAKLNVIFDELKPFQEKLNDLISERVEEIQMHKEEIESAQETLEEYQLRFFAGEFAEDDFEPKQAELTETIETSKSCMVSLESQISEYQAHVNFINGDPVDEVVADAGDDEHKDVDEEEESEEDPEGDSLAESEESSSDSVDQADDVEVDAENELDELDHLEEDEVVDVDEDEVVDSDEDASVDEFDDFKPEEDIVGDGDENQGLLRDTVDADILPDADFNLDDDEDSENDESQESDDDEEYEWEGIPILDVVDGDFTGESYTIDKERITMGRGPNNDIQLATDTSVSRHHAQIAQEDKKYVLVDLESSNGSSVNGMRISRAVLKPNDEIMIGQSKLIIRIQD